MGNSEGTNIGNDWRVGIAKSLFYSGIEKVVVMESFLGKASQRTGKERGESLGCPS